MSSFDKITAEIQKQIEESKILEPVASKGTPVTNPDGTPVMKVVGVRGRTVSRPGTETVTMDTSTLQMMECVNNAPGREKKRYCIIEKGKHAKYGNDFVTQDGTLCHVITRQVYTLLVGMLNNANTLLREYANKAERATEKAEMYKLTIDALKKNGIID